MQKCSSESQAISISGISIFARDLGLKMVMVKLLKVTPMMRMMKNITQQVLCLKVGKENIKVTTLYEQSEEGEAAEEEDEGSFFPYCCSL